MPSRKGRRFWYTVFLERRTQPLIYDDSAADAAFAARFYREQGELMRALGMAKKE